MWRCPQIRSYLHCLSCVGTPLAALPDKIGRILQQSLQRCMGGGKSSDSGIQSSFLWAMAALLCDAFKLYRSTQARLSAFVFSWRPLKLSILVQRRSENVRSTLRY